VVVYQKLFNTNNKFRFPATTKNQPTEKVRKVRDEYENKLNMMQKEMRNLTDAKKEYQKLLRSQSSYENQVKTLRSEVNEMRQTRVSIEDFYWRG
jgi:hypothetical protein